VPGCDLLVTGAGGFVGAHVLAQGRAVGLDVRATAGDLRDPVVVDEQIRRARPLRVIHLASRARRPRDPWLTLGEEIAVSGALLASLDAHVGDCCLLVAGTAAQYGRGAKRPLREADATEPVSAYGAVKCVLERALTTAPLTGGVRVIWTRSFNHVGPGQRVDAPVAGWARQIAAAEHDGGGVLRTGRLDTIRDFLDVRDVANAYLALVQADAEGVVNVCSGVGVRMHELVDVLLELAGTELRVEHDPALHRPHDPPHIVGDPARLRELTGWRPRVELRQSLEDVLAEWRATTATNNEREAHGAVTG
jgi:GDP-4-dehydro-6-deoxy-D-mannose reductase